MKFISLYYRREECRYLSQAKQHDGRDKINEAGHGLHGVQNRADHCFRDATVSHQDIHGNPEQEGDRHPGQDEGQGVFHHLLTQIPFQLCPCASFSEMFGR